MQLNYSSYIAGDTPLHRMDARAKLVLLAAYIVMLFLVESWLGLAMAALMAALMLALSRIGLGKMMSLLSPALVLAALLILFNCFTYVPSGQLAQTGETIRLVQLAGPLCLNIDGLVRGVFFAVRVILLVLSSLVVGLTTTSTELTAVASWFLAPLRRLGLPVDDMATVFSIALRFIPLMAEEFCRIRNAQWSRGCGFDDEGLLGRVRSWGKVLMPMIMSLFRKADNLAVAMDARCYGAADRRGSLVQMKLDGASAVWLVAGLAACALLAYLL